MNNLVGIRKVDFKRRKISFPFQSAHKLIKRVEKITLTYSRHPVTSKLLVSDLYELEATSLSDEPLGEIEFSKVFCLRKWKQPKIDFILRINRFVLLILPIVTILILVFQNCPETKMQSSRKIGNDSRTNAISLAIPHPLTR